MRSRSVRVADDVALHVLAWDGAPGVEPAFLLVHGLTSNARTWEAVGDRLSGAGHRVVAADLRGHGLSDKPALGYNLSTMGDDIRNLIDELDLDGAVAVGQSAGGNLVVDLASRHRGVLSGVVGVDGGSIELADRWAVWDECREALAPPPLEGTSSHEVESWLRRVHPDWPRWGIDATVANLEVLDDGTVRPWLTLDRHILILRSLWEHRPSQLFPGITVPLMLVFADTGDDWAMTKRAEAARATALRPDIRVEWFSPADHDVHVQRADEVAELIRSFGTGAVERASGGS
ncbi:MAG: alpha/beta fold hydrolase [Acidimicrobiales bacterium]